MAAIEQILDDVENLLGLVRVEEAEARLNDLILSVGPNELARWEPDIRQTIRAFLPKRRRRLLSVLDERLGNVFENARAQSNSLSSEKCKLAVKSLADSLNAVFRDLAEHHIFQWSTFYRDSLSPIFQESLMADLDDEAQDLLIALTQEHYAGHSKEIFLKGYHHQMEERHLSYLQALAKGVNGLQCFLELPIDMYSTSLSMVNNPSKQNRLRRLTSAMLAGIMGGFGEVPFSPRKGWHVLSQYSAGWPHYLGFLTSSDLGYIVQNLERTDYAAGLRDVICCLLAALDDLVADDTTSHVLPVLSQSFYEDRRIDISLRPPLNAQDPRLLEIQCYLAPDKVSKQSLEEASSKDVALVLAPMRADLLEYVAKSDHLRGIVVAFTPGESDMPRLRKKIHDVLEVRIYNSRSPRAGSVALTYNFARDFPLQNQFLTRYYHVSRTSIRELLRTFEKRNGVRLWCSVRRSGKTTACFDLGSTSGDATIISQTCAGTKPVEDADRFYQLVHGVIRDKQSIDKGFFENAVASCAPGPSSGASRIVFVLDEYETLFGRLKAAAESDDNVRYAIAQPLLDQMVAFTRDNLLVFLGQQPDAHYVLMDQNQLSAYMEQDAFPLFYRSNPDYS